MEIGGCMKTGGAWYEGLRVYNRLLQMERKDRHENGLARKTVLAIETLQNNKLKKFTQTSRNSPKQQVAGKHLEV